MFLEWDRLEGMVVNEAINLPGYLHRVKTVSNLHLTIIEKPQPWSVWSPFNCSSWIPQENELKLSNYAVPFSNLRFSLFLVRQVLEWSWSLSRYSAQESSGRHHFRPCTSFPLRGHLLPLLLPPTRRPRCQGLHLHVHASSNVRISRLSKNWQPPPSRSSSMNSYRALMPPIAYLTYLDYALIVNLALCAVCLLTVIASAVPPLHIWGFW